MSKEIYISSTPHETRLAIVEHDELTEIYYERENEYTLAGSIYNGKVTRVLPGMQSSFVDVGLERDAFLYITDFMEEAGDSADFDTSESRGRSNGRRNDRGRDGQGSDGTAADGHERSSVEAGDSDSAQVPLQEGRTLERGERNDRGDRGRRRGRGGNREGQPREVRPAAETPAYESRDESGSAPSAPIQINAPESGTEAELGEGAPGADGSRRWRGRRGRRRGRSGAREGSPVDQAIAGVEAETAAPDPSSGYDFQPASETDPFDSASAEAFALEGSADSSLMQADQVDSSEVPGSLAALDESSLVDGTAAEPTRSSAFRESRNAGQRDGAARDANDRGRRDRGGRGGRGGRDRRDDRPRAPRGFTPSRSLYGVDDAADQQGADGPPIEPVILPGESLSKYRSGGEAAQSASVPVKAAPPAEFTLPGTWDGGSVLPGETLRPRSASAALSSEPAREGRRDSGREGGSRRGGRPESRRDDRSSRERQPEATFAVAPVVPFRNEPAPIEQDTDGPSVAAPPEAAAIVRDASAAVAAREAEVSAQEPEMVSQAPMISPPADAVEAASEPVPLSPGEQEYEPTEGSASHRFDPVPPREFRQPAPEMEAMPELPQLADSITPPAGTPLTPLHSEEDVFVPSLQTERFGSIEEISETPLEHDLTSITSDGEMHSEAPQPPPAEEIAAPTSPIQHETVILHAEVGTPISTEPESQAAALPFVAPEISAEAEELIVEELSQEDELDGDEEDYQTTTLHAASIEEMDYDEDEMLDGTADLGTMLREMSIDQITQPAEPAIAEDDDDFAFEEEDSVEEDSFVSTQHATMADPMGFTEEDFGGEGTGDDKEESPSVHLVSGTETASQEQQRNDRRRGGRRDGRRGGRDRDRGGDRGRSSSPVSASSSGDRDRNSGSRPGRRDGHRSAQLTNLPAISDLLKPGQEVLVQIAKEPIAKKGARITSHIALPGRFLVFMPTVNHTGVSRKIESDSERRRLKEILLSEKGEASGGFIVRTAASGASEEELRSDLRFLLNLWADIKQRSEASKSPALIYHDLNLVERILRDQVTDNFSAIWVDTESEYERVLRFLQRFQPSLIRRVKLYTKDTPLFEQFGITEEINKALRSKVWLRSGGSIVINQTEALVAIDINTGKYVGKTARLEDTIVKTNLDAIPEIVRQIRLRDLGGIIIIDFIDMDERKNRQKVMTVLEEELKKDRAPSKVLQFNDFGLVAITRKRVKQSLERTLSTTCGICAGTGMVKSAVTVCNDIYIEMRKMQKNLDRGDVMLRVNPEVVKQLKSPTAKWLQEMEEMVGKTILVKSDPALHPEQFDIH